MTDISIKVENVSKRYQIGAHKTFPTLRDKLIELVHYPYQLLTGTLPKKNESFIALNNISFEVKKGEIVGIIGRNGAGKSTLLKILSRITEPTSGTITMKGRVASMLEVGTGFNMELTGRENIYLNGAIIGMTRKEINEQFNNIVEFAGVGKFLDTPVKHYSSGMYVRLAFAVAAHLNTDILLIDEVLAVGDTDFQKKCLGKIGSISRSGKTIIFVSHNLATITSICSKIILLESGKVAFKGGVNEGLQKYTSKFNEPVKIDWGAEDSPSNEGVKLRSISIHQPNQYKNTILISQKILIDIEYVNSIKNRKLTTTVQLKDYLGTYVFASSNYRSVSKKIDSIGTSQLDSGVYMTRCEIPANFLNDNIYSIDVGIVSQNGDWLLRLDNVLSFSVTETGDMRKEYKGDWVGTIRPKLEWNTKKTS